MITFFTDGKLQDLELISSFEDDVDIVLMHMKYVRQAEMYIRSHIASKNVHIFSGGAHMNANPHEEDLYGHIDITGVTFFPPTYRWDRLSIENNTVYMLCDVEYMSHFFEKNKIIKMFTE